MSTSAERRKIRQALDGLGFKRLNATLDKGDGVYSELFSDQDDNCLTISWTERTPEPTPDPDVDSQCLATDEFDGQCIYRMSHDEAFHHRYEGGDEDARHQAALAALRAEKGV